ncbi:MAG: hypothetical protein MI754_13365, partial [Chromatiales bacterium]|nr:hypothetical protein [Chromatiales bacterium]
MIEISSLVFVVAFELVFLSTAVSIGLITTALVQKRKDRAAARKLTAKIKEEAQSRLAETERFLTRQLGFSAEDAEKIAKRISYNERFFYQTAITVYLRRDHNTLANLSINFEEAVAPYRALEPQLSGESGAGQAQTEEETVSTKELQRLTEENSRLKDELSVTMDTMGRMLSEYSSMFDGNTEGSEAPIEHAGEATQEAPTQATVPEAQEAFLAENGAAELERESLIDADEEILLDDVMESDSELSETVAPSAEPENSVAEE